MDAKNAPLPLLLGRPTAARLLGVSMTVLERMVEEGTLEEVKLHPQAHPRVRRADVEALVGGVLPPRKAGR